MRAVAFAVPLWERLPVRWPRWLGFGERRWSKSADEEVAPAKTLWDVLQLLIVPAMLAAIALAFSMSQDARDRAIAEDDRQDKNLQAYFDRMSDLILDHGLAHTKPGSSVSQLARNVTL